MKTKEEKQNERLEKLKEQLKEKGKKNQELNERVQALNQEVAEAKKSEDFTKLSEIYKEAKELSKWSRRVTFGKQGEISFDISYSSVQTKNSLVPWEDWDFSQTKEAWLELTQIINEASKIQEQLDNLAKRLYPLREVIDHAKRFTEDD